MFQTNQSSALYDRACKTLALGVSSGLRRHVTPVPLYFDHANGPYYYDVDNHELIDYTLAWGPLILGSNHPTLNEAISKQLTKGYTFGAQHEAEINLCELLVEILPGVEQVILSNTGSEAAQAAVRIARATTDRDKVLRFAGHYHGWFNNILVVPNDQDPTSGQAASVCGGQPSTEFADTLVLPWNDIAVVEKIFERYEEQIACVITEPLLANGGCCEPQDGYLQSLIDLCHKHGAISIFDEVITGFRLALGGAREYFQLNPDLTIYAKAIAGGFPMGAVAGRAEIFDCLRDGRTLHMGTYNGNCLSVTAATATIGVLREPGTFERMQKYGRTLRSAIESAAARHKQQVITCGAGSVFSVHFGLDSTPQTFAATLKADKDAYLRFKSALLDHGIHTVHDGRWYISAVHTEKELEETINAIDKSMAVM